MANPGRSSEGPYPDRQPDRRGSGNPYPDEQYAGQRRGSQPYPPQEALPQARPREPWGDDGQPPWGPLSAPVPEPPAPAPQPPPGSQLPPPEWADSPMNHRWTTSWRIRPTAAQPVLPDDRPGRPPATARPTTMQPAMQPTGMQSTAIQPAALQAGTMTRRDTGAWPVPDGGQTQQLPPWEGGDPQAGPRATGSMGAVRATGSFRATGAHHTQGVRATGAMRATGAIKTTGSMRTVKPIAPGTGQARVVLPIVVLVAIALGFLGVAYLWWQHTVFIHSPGAILVDLGEILGLIAGYGIVILVALMSRLPPLERGVGTDRLARWHATGGRWIISTVTGHVVFIIWGYAALGHTSVTSETASLVTTFPDILMALVSWLILLGIAGFSMRAARRRMSYETWYYSHLYTYLAIALAFSHQFADGGTFSTSFQARVAWIGLYALVGGLLLWYRVITPLWNSSRYQFTVQSVRPEAAGIVSVFISGRDFDRLRAEPGQFFRWRFLTKALWWQSHPYSLSAMPQPDLMRITVKARGDHSRSLSRLQPGTRIIAEGPYGAFTPSLTGRRVLFIAGGVGITPIRAMFAALPKRMSGGITLLYRASHPRDVVFSRELNAIASDRQAALHYLVGSRADLGFDPLDAEHLAQTVPGLHRYEAYVCGPTGMTEAAVRSLVAAGVPRRRIHHESFDF